MEFPLAVGMTGFKEWQVVCEALGSGRQSLVLRKGGIHEGREGFSFAHGEFFLFPTRFHGQAGRVREGDCGTLPEWAEGESVRIRHFAEVAWARTLRDWGAVEALETVSHLERGNRAGAVRLGGQGHGGGQHPRRAGAGGALAEPWEFPYEQRFAGCRSWIDLPEAPEAWRERIVPVIGDDAYATIAARIEELVGVEDGAEHKRGFVGITGETPALRTISALICVPFWSGEVSERRDAQALKGEIGVDRVDLGHGLGDQCGVAAGGDDHRAAVDFGEQAVENAANQPAVAVDGPGAHGLHGGLADGAFRLGQIDPGQQGRALGQVVGHRAEPGRDGPAAVGGGRGDHVEGHGGAEVDDDCGTAVAGFHRDGVGQAIGADLGGFRVVDADAEPAVGAEEMHRCAGAEVVAEHGSSAGHHRGDDARRQSGAPRAVRRAGRRRVPGWEAGRASHQVRRDRRGRAWCGCSSCRRGASWASGH